MHSLYNDAIDLSDNRFYNSKFTTALCFYGNTVSSEEICFLVHCDNNRIKCLANLVSLT